MSNLYLALSSAGYLKLGLTSMPLRQCLQLTAYRARASLLLIGLEKSSEGQFELLQEQLKEGNAGILGPNWYYDWPIVRGSVSPYEGELILSTFRLKPFHVKLSGNRKGEVSLCLIRKSTVK